MEDGPPRPEPQRPQGHLQFNLSPSAPPKPFPVSPVGAGLFPLYLCVCFLVFALICSHLSLCQSLCKFHLALKSVAESVSPPSCPHGDKRVPSWSSQEVEAGLVFSEELQGWSWGSGKQRSPSTEVPCAPVPPLLGSLHFPFWSPDLPLCTALTFLFFPRAGYSVPFFRPSPF